MKDDADHDPQKYIAKIALLGGGMVLLSELLIRLLLSQHSSFSLFRLMAYYFSGGSLLYLFESRSRGWLQRHEIFFVILGVVVPIMLFFWQMASDESQKYYKYEISLKETNNRNIGHLKSIVHDLPNDKDVAFWRNFSLTSYYEYWDYMAKNYSQECKNLYAEMAIALGVLNELNNARRDLLIARAAISTEQHWRAEKLNLSLVGHMIDTASSTLPIAYSIVGKCQQF